MDTVVRERVRVGAQGDASAASVKHAGPHADRVQRGQADFAAGSVAIGRVLTTLAGRAAGWWPSRQIGEALTRYTPEDDNYYRAHFAHLYGDGALVPFDDVRVAYVIGHLAAFNHEYAGQGWDPVERDVSAAWADGVGETWGEVRNLVRDAYRRASSADYQLWRGQLNDAEA